MTTLMRAAAEERTRRLPPALVTDLPVLALLVICWLRSVLGRVFLSSATDLRPRARTPAGLHLREPGMIGEWQRPSFGWSRW